MVEKNIICEFCGDKFGSKSGIYTHQRTIAKCLAIQMKKLGKFKYKPVKEDPSKKKAAKEKPANNKPVKQAEKPKEEVSDEDDVSENDEIPLESSSDDDDVEIKGMSSSEEETDKEDSDKEDAIKFFKGMGATKFDNIKTFKKKYSTSSREVINDDNVKEEIKEQPREQPKEQPKEQPVNNEINDRISKLDSKVGEMMTTIVKVGDSVKKLNDLFSQFITKNDKNIVNDITSKIEEIFGTTIENNVETSKKILAEIDSKNETLEIFKEDIEETCDKYYEIYKKFKSIKEDMEDMVGARSSRRK